LKAPTAIFPPGFLHPNVYPDGHVCLSILNDDEDLGGTWASSISVKQKLAEEMFREKPQKYQ